MSEANEKSSIFGIIKKIILIALAMALSGIIIWVIVGGGKDEEPEIINREYDKEEVIAAARDLIERSVVLSEIYFGDGIPYIDDEKDTSNYRPADTEYLENLGIKYIEDLKNLTRGVFSEAESEFLFSRFLDRLDSDEFVGLAHYISSYDGEGEEKEETGILVYKKREKNALVRKEESTTHDYNTISVIGSEGERVKISIKSTVLCDDGRSCTLTNEIYLIEEDSGWRLDSQTKCAYIEE